MDLAADRRVRHRLALDGSALDGGRLLDDAGASFPLEAEGPPRDLRITTVTHVEGLPPRPEILIRLRRADLARRQWMDAPRWLLWRTVRLRVTPDMMEAVRGPIYRDED